MPESKFSVFQVILVSANKLTRYIEPCQLTDEFGGSLVYNHLDWVNKRLVSTKLLYLLVDYNNSEMLWLVWVMNLAGDIKLSKIVSIGILLAFFSCGFLKAVSLVYFSSFLGIKLSVSVNWLVVALIPHLFKGLSRYRYQYNFTVLCTSFGYSKSCWNYFTILFHCLKY